MSDQPKGTVYVAIVPLKYEVMAVATTPADAIRIACNRALRRLRAADAVSSDTNTAAKIADYFSVYATRCEIGKTALIGCD